MATTAMWCTMTNQGNPMLLVYSYAKELGKFMLVPSPLSSPDTY